MYNVALLGLAQLFVGSGSIMVTLLAGILGARMAPHPGLATLGVTLAIVMLACTSIPAALLMQWVGRKRGFIVGSSIGVAAGLLAARAVAIDDFVLMCASMALIGATMAFAQQFRFAAAESVTPERVSRAVSLVMVGTLGAAWMAPEIAVLTRHALGDNEYIGTFVALSGLYAVSIVLLACLRPVRPASGEAGDAARPFATIARQPVFIAAVGCATIAWGVMSFIMTATPISMHVVDGHGVEDTARVIQGHVIAMYLPALFSGWLIARAGLRPVMIAGVVLMLACVGLALLDRQVSHYWSALVLLGVGWNFLFVGGTTLLTMAYRPAERFRVQAVNEFTVFGTTAAASLGAGFAIQAMGWQVLNLLTLPLLALALVAVLTLRRGRRGPDGVIPG